MNYTGFSSACVTPEAKHFWWSCFISRFYKATSQTTDEAAVSGYRPNQTIVHDKGPVGCARQHAVANTDQVSAFIVSGFSTLFPWAIHACVYFAAVFPSFLGVSAHFDMRTWKQLFDEVESPLCFELNVALVV